MLPDGRRLGAHLPLAPGMLKALDRAEAIGASAIQVFADNPTAWRRRSEPSPQLEAFRSRATAARHPADLDPRLVPREPARTRCRDVRAVRRHAGRGARRAPRRSVRASSTSTSDRIEGPASRSGSDRLVDGIEAVFARSPFDAVVTERVDARARELRGRWRRPRDDRSTNWSPSPVGLTTRVHRPGSRRVLPRHGTRLGCRHRRRRPGGRSTRSSPASTTASASIGSCSIHLNDTRSELRLADRPSRAPRCRAHPRGGLAHVLRHPRLTHAAYIIETPGMDVGYDAINLERARALWAGTPLAALPHEAFALPSSSRGRMAPADPRDDDGPRPRPRPSSASRCPALLVLAALLRLPDLATRGTWDGDQGHDMLVLRTFVRDGLVPLLGPPTSIGDVHHGAWYYYLLSRRGLPTGGDSPLAVVVLIAVGRDRGGRRRLVARAIDRRAGRRRRRRDWSMAAVGRRGRRIDVHLEPEPHRAVERDRRSRPRGSAWSGGDRRWWLARGHRARRSRCSATSWASRCCPIVAAPFILDARRRPLGPVLTRHPRDLRHRLPAACDQRADDRASRRSEPRSTYSRAAVRRPKSRSRSGSASSTLRVLSWPLTGLIADGFVAGSLATGRRHRHRRVALAGDRRRRALRRALVRARVCSGRSRS